MKKNKIVIPDQNVKDFSTVKRSWMERLFSFTPWRSTKVIHEPVAYMATGKDGTQIIYVSPATYKKWKDSGKLNDLLDKTITSGHC